MNEIEFEFEFTVDHEDFKGSISCSKKIYTDKDVDDPDITRVLYEQARVSVCNEFKEKWVILD